MGSFALQGMKGTSIAVRSCSFFPSIARAERIAGTEHPAPTMKDTSDLPLMPTLRNKRSKRKLTRARYPEASRRARSKKRMSS